MDEKFQKIINSVDPVIEKLQLISKLIDKLLDMLKLPIFKCIPALVNKLASGFGSVIIALFALIYALYCFKNAVVCCFFEDAPGGFAIAMAGVAIVSIVANCYLVHKTLGMFDKIISTSQCRISSLNIFSIFTFVNIFAAICSVPAGVYFMFEFKDFMFLIRGVVGFVLFILLALYSSAPEDFAIVADENASAGDDFATIVTFTLKVALRLVPIAVVALAIIGICQCIPHMFTAYITSYGDSHFLNADEMTVGMTYLGMFLLVGLLPLQAYVYYLISYVSLDLIRAVLSLPGKLDNAKK